MIIHCLDVQDPVFTPNSFASFGRGKGLNSPVALWVGESGSLEVLNMLRRGEVKNGVESEIHAPTRNKKTSEDQKRVQSKQHHSSRRRDWFPNLDRLPKQPLLVWADADASSPQQRGKPRVEKPFHNNEDAARKTAAPDIFGRSSTPDTLLVYGGGCTDDHRSVRSCQHVCPSSSCYHFRQLERQVQLPRTETRGAARFLVLICQAPGLSYCKTWLHRSVVEYSPYQHVCPSSCYRGCTDPSSEALALWFRPPVPLRLLVPPLMHWDVSTSHRSDAGPSFLTR
jgi:hypothetical protein